MKYISGQSYLVQTSPSFFCGHSVSYLLRKFSFLLNLFLHLVNSCLWALKDKMNLILLLLAIVCTKVNACPNEVGWIAAGDSCYLVSPEKLSWYGAQEFCFQHNGYLAEIKSEKEEGILHHFLLGKTTKKIVFRGKAMSFVVPLCQRNKRPSLFLLNI